MNRILKWGATCILATGCASASVELFAQALDNASLQSAYTRDAKLITNDTDGATLFDPAVTVPVIRQEWSIVEQYVTSQVAGSAPVDAQAYQRILAQLTPQLQTFAINLQRGATLIAFNQYDFGHVMIAFGKSGGKLQFWQIDGQAPSAGELQGQLSCWTPGEGRSCYTRAIGLLPDDASGAQRFYIEAGYAQVAGATTGHQLSIWRWNGEVATPLYVTLFTGMADAQREGVHVDGDAIRIVQKDQDHWNVLDPCGACGGRQVAQLLRLTPHGVSDEGTVSMTPELDLVDEIYARFRAGQSAETLASPSVLQFMRRSWVSNEMDQRSFGFLKMLFMNVPETVTPKGDATQLCFRAYYGIRNDSMTAILFTFARKGSQLRIVDAQQNAAGCMPEYPRGRAPHPS